MTIAGGTEAATDVAGIRAAVAAWIEWQMAAGVDCTLGQPSRGLVNASPARVSPEAGPSSASGPVPAASAPVATGHRPARTPGTGAPVFADARALARSCRTLEELRATLERFEGCPLSETATRLCFADGAPDAPLMLIGEAPGAEEDRLGRPFVGQSGRLLDRMLAWIGRDRSNCWITNVIFWRPPGNRSPTPAEVAICQPFLERQIELIRPRLLLFLGGIAARALLGVGEGVSRLRGRRFTYRNELLGEPVPALVTFHPAYLLRQPAQKRQVWRDLLQVAEMLEQIEGSSEKEC